MSRNLEARISKLEAVTNSRRVVLFVWPHPGEADLRRRILEKAASAEVPARNVAVLLWGNPAALGR